MWSESEGDSGTLCGTGQLSIVSGQSAPQQRTGELLNLLQILCKLVVTDTHSIV